MIKYYVSVDYLTSVSFKDNKIKVEYYITLCTYGESAAAIFYTRNIENDDEW